MDEQALRARILELPPSPDLDAFTALVARSFGVSLCVISIEGRGRYWFRARVGVDVGDIAPKDSLCQNVLRTRGVFVIPDLVDTTDFADHPLTNAPLHLRFFTGVPLLLGPGLLVGSLCIADQSPHTPSKADIETLCGFADLAAALLRGYLAIGEAREAAAALDQHNRLLERRQRDLDIAARRFAFVERLGGIGAWEMDLISGAVGWSPQMHEITGIPADGRLDLERALSVYSPEDRVQMDAKAAAASAGGVYEDEYRIITPAGVEKWVRAVGEYERSDANSYTAFGVLQDITADRQASDLLARTAATDLLTGLPNRGPFVQRLQAAADADARPAVILVDADGLKTVNDTLGHAFGDELIKAIACRCAEAVGDRGTVYRLSGDEFAIILDDADAAAVTAFAAAIVSRCAVPFQHRGQTLLPEASVGAAIAEPGASMQTLRQNADMALYHAKETNRGGFVLFEEGLRTAIMRRVETVRSVDEALTENRMTVHYQPLVALGSGAIIGLEALARMTLPDGRLVAAGAFQDAMADAKVAYRLTERVLDIVAADVAAWLASGIPFQHVGINVTTADFQRGDLEHRIAAAFGSRGVPLHHAVLEITESVYMGRSDTATITAIEALRARGMLVALDDFGTGFASLTQLIGFPVDIIKIDRSFVQRMLTDAPSAAVVEMLLDLARKLDMRVVAEGIETEAQAEHLRHLGCRLGQGYFYARPASAATTAVLMRRFGQKPAGDRTAPFQGKVVSRI